MTKLRIDEIDLAIIEILTRNGEIKRTTTELAKEIHECVERSDIIKYTTNITYRVNKLALHNILFIDKINNKKYYSTNKNTVNYGECTIDIAGKKINIGEALIIEMPNKHYHISFIEDIE